MSHDDYEREPIPGLPAVPPAGEAIIWQGSPHWPTVARRILHLDLIAAYFAILLGWRILSAAAAGEGAAAILASVIPLAAVSGVAIGVLALISWAIGRTTIYTITSRRVVMRIGVALPITFNIPFRKIAAASVRKFGRGRGDIALELAAGERLAYLVLWPHARPWRLRWPQPMLRALPEIDVVAKHLADALAADASRAKAVRLPTEATELTPLRPYPTMVAAE